MLGDGVILASVVTFALAAGSPGPATLAVSAAAMSRGIRSGLSMAFGLSFGLTFWGILAALGFGSTVAQSAFALTVLKIIGGVYLLYLAANTARSSLRKDTGEQNTGGQRGGFRSGLILNLANPKAVLAWVAALALGGAQTVQASVPMVVFCSMTGCLIYVIYALLFSRSRVMSFYRVYRGWIEAVFSALFAAAGLRLIFWKNATG